MKLLLDENLPKRLIQDLAPYQAYSVRQMGWNGKKNGELLKLMLENEFTALLTFDKNLQHQQNFDKYTIAVIVLNAKSNSYLTLKELVPKLLEILKGGLENKIIEVKL